VRRAWWSLVLAGCATDASQAHEPMLTMTDANAVVTVTTSVANLIAQRQGTGTSAQMIMLDEDIACGSGSGHLMGTGQYVPTAGQSVGYTTFDATVSLAGCAFTGGALSATQLTVRGPLQPGFASNNLTFRGEVSWPPMTDVCTITMKLYGASFEMFMGTVCAYGVTAQTIAQLPP
jgi:hypothetical protein